MRVAGLAVIVAVAVAGHSFAADQNQLDGSPAIFSVLAAVNAAGCEQAIDSPAKHPLRMQIRKHLASRKIQCLAELKRFVRDHNTANPGQQLSQHTSLAHSTDEPPNFKDTFRR